jgi:hypothetical protein
LAKESECPTQEGKIYLVADPLDRAAVGDLGKGRLYPPSSRVDFGLGLRQVMYWTAQAGRR